jgi:protein-tyrosine phosphatase
LATREGVSPDAAAAHRSRALTEGLLRSPDLILVMTRDHRRQVLEMAPVRMRSTFTIREFARLAAEATDAEIGAAAADAGDDPSDRLRAACDVVASYRGMAPAPGHAEDDDVIDPYRRSWDTYELAAAQLLPAVGQVTRVTHLTVTND